jgi:D-alanyl-D-alanine carboxypeptidase
MTQRSFDQAIDAIVEFLGDRHHQGLGPGLSLALTSREHLLATRTWGVANADSGELVNEATLFQIGSITKQITAVACLRLQEQGQLDLEAPITRYLPWFRVGSRFQRPVTLHHLLTHTAGLVMMMDSYPSSWAQTWALRDTELGFEPGSKFSYSNVGYNVLQCAIQTVTRLRFHAALQELVFRPLGMTDSWGEILHSLHSTMAKGHKYSVHDDHPASRPERQTVVNWYETSQGCGSVVTTAADLARFLRMFLRRGRTDDGSVFLSASAFDRMLAPHASFSGFFDGTTQGYGVLIEQSEATGRRARIIGGGENLGFEASMYGDFEAGVGVVLLCNSFDIHWGETRWILDTLVAAAHGGALPPRPSLPPLSGEPVAERAYEYVGTYRSAARSFSIAREGDSLSLTSGSHSSRLEPIYGDNFVLGHPDFEPAMLTFGRNGEGAVVEAFHLGDWYRGERYAGPTESETPEEWKAYEGHYRCFGILITNIRIFARKGRLTCQAYSGYVDQPLTDLGDGRFRAGDESSPEFITFDWFADGKALRCRFSGTDFYRVP